MEFLASFLPILLYVVAIVLLVVLIVLGIKLIKVVDKVDGLVVNVEEKINTFNGALSVMKQAADGISSISDTVVYTVTTAVSKLVNKFIKNKEDHYE